MKCYANRYSTKLLNIPSTAQVAVTTEGTGYRLLPDQSDGQTDAAQDYKVVTNLNVTGGTSPTAQIVVQGSVDGSTWIDLATGTQRGAAGNFREVLDPANVGLLPWVRARVVLGGTANPSVDVTVELVSTGGFQLATS
jgi:hypothetical protein